jgi:hypothetical protein
MQNIMTTAGIHRMKSVSQIQLLYYIKIQNGIFFKLAWNMLKEEVGK